MKTNHEESISIEAYRMSDLEEKGCPIKGCKNTGKNAGLFTLERDLLGESTILKCPVCGGEFIGVPTGSSACFEVLIFEGSTKFLVCPTVVRHPKP